MLVEALTVNWVLMSPMTVLYSVTKLLIEFVMEVVSGPTVTVTGVAESALVRFESHVGDRPGHGVGGARIRDSIDRDDRR